MTDTLAHQNWNKRLDCVFYAQFVSPDVFNNILNRFSGPQAEEAFQTVLNILDYTALTSVVRSLPDGRWQSFLQTAAIKYNSESLLELLQQNNPEALPALQQAIERQLLTIYSELDS